MEKSNLFFNKRSPWFMDAWEFQFKECMFREKSFGKSFLFSDILMEFFFEILTDAAFVNMSKLWRRRKINITSTIIQIPNSSIVNSFFYKCLVVMWWDSNSWSWPEHVLLKNLILYIGVGLKINDSFYESRFHHFITEL